MEDLPKINFKVSHVRGFFLNASGGNLWLEPDRFYFNPHAVNFDMRNFVWTYDQIAGYRKDILTYLKVKLRDGRVETFQTFKKGTVIQALEQRRQAWYAKNNMKAPELEIF